MSLSVAARPVLRQSARRMATRRFESTTAKATEGAKQGAAKAKDTASEYASKAQQGLSKVTSAAGPAIAGAAKGLSSTLGKVGGRTGRLIAFVERQVPQVIYYGRVGAELSKIVFKGQKMTPPSASTFQSYFNNALNSVKNPNSLVQSASQAAQSQSPSNVISRARNLNRAQLAAGGVILAESLGFFTIGEMIGRFKLIGYHGDNGHAHH